jgi:hypothetical protein
VKLFQETENPTVTAAVQPRSSHAHEEEKIARNRAGERRRLIDPGREPDAGAVYLRRALENCCTVEERLPAARHDGRALEMTRHGK